MIDQIERQFNCDASGSFIVGDSKRDLDAGLAKGCIPILVKTGKGIRTLNKGLDIPNLVVCEDLFDAVEYILGDVSRET